MAVDQAALKNIRADFADVNLPGLLPVDQATFDQSMARLGPWGAPKRRVGVAVSGGADSLALAFLAARWSDIVAFVVDHGLRAESAREAMWTIEQLRQHGIKAELLTLTGLLPGPALAERARRARYEALEEACLRAGIVDLLLGHHRRDQAETILLRRSAGSGNAGLACMASEVLFRNIRLLRPLLAVPPGRLKATLAEYRQSYIDDPSNSDERWRRPFIRRRLNDPTGEGGRISRLVRRAARAALQRAAEETEIAEETAAYSTFLPEGCVILERGLSAPALSKLLQCVSGASYPPARDAVSTIVTGWREATLHGCRIMKAGRLGGQWLVARELSATSPLISLTNDLIWDNRFRFFGISGGGGDLVVGALGDGQARFRRRHDLPAAVLATTPAIYRDGDLIAAPFVGAPLTEGFCRFTPSTVLSGAPFF